MKKLFFLFLAVALSATALASPTGNKMGEQRDVLIMSKNQSVNQGRPRAPELTLFNACLDTDLCALFISSAYDVNEVTARVENLSTGEYDMYSGRYPFSVPVIPVHFLGVKTDYLLRS